MDERKILLFIFSVFIYCLYSVQMWYAKHENAVEAEKIDAPPVLPQPVASENTTKQPTTKHVAKVKIIPLVLKDACSVLEVFTRKPTDKPPKPPVKPKAMESDHNALTVIGITVFLVILALNAVLDVLKVKEEERARNKLNPDGGRRESLAEFANKKPLRRESSRFSFQLFQIAEATPEVEEQKKESRRQARPYTRGESTNSYLSDNKRKNVNEGSAPASISETPTGEPKLVKRQSVAKLFGARPVPMVRRSSFPALPLNPEVQALMLGHRQASVDSDDEDGRGRRVRIIRRY